MKINGAQGLSNLGSAKRAGKRAGGDFKIDDGASAAREAAPAAPAGPIASIDAIIALQGQAGADGEARKRAADRGERLLSLLDGVRLGLLTGGIPQAKLKALSAAVAARRDALVDDPHLSAILDDIDLRARVELAKYGV
ncbi:MAG: flagellar assembly protein FliX [Pseudomonadota bacterium]